jgi:hypothetical protein
VPTSGWFITEVTVGCTASDGGSGLTSTSPDSFELQTNVDDGSAAVAAPTSAQSLSDAVGNTATAGPYTFKVDRAAPTVVITVPAAGLNYSLNESATPVFSCDDLGSGIGSCTASSSVLDTSTVGTRTFTVTAVDVAGNTRVKTQTYTVGYAVCLEYNPQKPQSGTSTAVIKLQLCDDQGVNLTSPDMEVKATLIDGDTAPPPNYQGNSNYGALFRFTGDSMAYNLDLSQLTELTKGYHTMSFTVDGVASAAYQAGFTLK